MAGDELLADRNGVGMKPEQNKSHRKLGEKEYPVQYRQPSKEQTGETAYGPAVNAQRYLSIYENEIEGIYLCTPEDRFVTVSSAFARMHGYASPGEMFLDLTMTPDKLYVDRQDEARYKHILHKHGVVEGIEIERYRKDGSTFRALCNARAVKDSAGRIIYYEGTVQDMTEKKDLDDHLRQALKMEAVGQLASGIAHDLNNILTVLIGFGNLVNARIGDNHHLKPYIEQMVTASEKAADLTQSLLSFSRKRQISLKPYGVNGIVRNAATLLRRLLTEDIEIQTVLTEENPFVLTDIIQIEQVLINLATNARDAMPQGGLLKIETQVTTINGETENQCGYDRSDKYGLISVTDNGMGIDEATRKHIFQPFFTTKETGRGTGLGLSTVYGIVKQHNGLITVHSQPGKGSTFNIYLPLTGRLDPQRSSAGRSSEVPCHEQSGIESERRQDGVRQAGEDAPPKIQPGGEIILVAEDNPAVRSLMLEVLRMQDYVVIEATDGEEAIRVFRENQDKIDLVILDAVMPRKNGMEACEAIKKARAETRVLLMSGYAEDIVFNKGVEDKTVEFVSKPLSPEELLKKVREVLDKP